MEFNLTHNGGSCSTCHLCRSRKRSEDLLRKVQNTQPKWETVDVTIKQETHDRVDLREAFANIMATLGATSAQCEAYLGCCGTSMDDKDYRHFSRYHCPRGKTYRTTQVHLNLAPEENRPLEEEEAFDTIDAQAQTQPYHVYGTYDFDDLPSYQRPLQYQVHIAGQPVVRETAPVSSRQFRTTAPIPTNTAGDQSYKFQAHGTIRVKSPVPQQRNKSPKCWSEYHVNCTKEYQPRSVHQRNKSTRPKSAQIQAEKGTYRAKIEYSGRATSPSLDISFKTGSNVNTKRSENVLKLSSRPKQVHVDRVISLHPGQTATLRLVK